MRRRLTPTALSSDMYIDMFRNVGWALARLLLLSSFVVGCTDVIPDFDSLGTKLGPPTFGGQPVGSYTITDDNASVLVAGECNSKFSSIEISRDSGSSWEAPPATGADLDCSDGHFSFTIADAGVYLGFLEGVAATKSLMIRGLNKNAEAEPGVFLIVYTGGVPLTIGTITPNVGNVAGGANVNITGTGFAAGMTVELGGNACANLVVVTSTSLTCDVPAHAAAFVDVTLTVGLNQVTKTNGFQYTPTPVITIAANNANEGDGGVDFTISISPAPATPVTVNYATVAGTAVDGSDYGAVTGAVSLSSANPSQIINVSISDDSLYEDDEAFDMAITTGDTGVNIGNTNATAAIFNDDAKPTVSFASATSNFSEGSAANVTVTASLSAVSGKAVTFDVVMSGTASGGGADYSAPASPMTILAGSTVASITIPVTDDLALEAPKTIVVTLSNPVGGDLGAISSHTINLKDNEQALAVINNAPADPSSDSALNVNITGTEVWSYKYVLALAPDCSGVDWSGVTATFSLAAHITDPLTAQGDHVLCVKAISSSGIEQSTPTSYHWVRDSVAPTAVITAGQPPAATNDSNYNITVGGTDVVKYVYKLATSNTCSNPAGYSAETAVSNHISGSVSGEGFKWLCIKGRDAVGNYQATASVYSWEYDITAPDAFSIAGVGGGSDAVADDYLIGSTSPRIYWFDTNGESSYGVYIYQSDGTTQACTPHFVGAGVTNASPLCTLTTGNTYKAKVVAFDAATNSTIATNASYTFQVVSSPATLTLSPAGGYDFGTQATGSTSAVTLTLTNSGGAPAQAISPNGLGVPIQFAGGTYPGGGSCTSNLAPGASCTLNLNYSPTDIGPDMKTLQLDYANGLGPDALTYNLQGTGVLPATLTITDGAVYDFGSNILVNTTATHLFRLDNTGGYTASGISETGLAAPFSIGSGWPGTGGDCGPTLVPGGSCYFAVTYGRSSVLGPPDTDRIIVSYNDGAAISTAERDVMGTTVGMPDVNFTVGSQIVSESDPSATATMTLSHTVNVPVTVPMTFGGSASAFEYSLPVSPPYTIPAGSSTKTITVNLNSADGTLEPRKWIVMTMGTPTNANLGPQDAHAIYINDDEVPTATFAGLPATDPSNMTTLNVTIGGTQVSEYKYWVGTGSTCSGASYGATWIPVANPITDAVPGASGSQVVICAIGRSDSGVQSAVISYSWVKDTDPPVPSFSSAVGSPTTIDLLPVQVDFQENVNGLTTSDFSVTNATIVPGSFQALSASQYKMVLYASGNGTVSIDLPAAKVTDDAGNNNSAATTYSWTFTLPTGGWSTISTGTAPSARSKMGTHWMGTKLFLFGGEDGSGVKNDAYYYDPTDNTWSTVTATSPPAARSGASVVYDGKYLIVWGGDNGTATPLNSGGRLANGATSWITTSTISPPAGRKQHSAVWTGSEMVVWGGIGTFNAKLNTGSRYNPATDTWTALPTTGTVNAPMARSGHAAVFTGKDMLIWGGESGSGPLNTGGKFNFGAGVWENMATTNQPAARKDFAYVWTGELFIVWGGEGTTGLALNDGGIYNAETDTWLTFSQSGEIPSARKGAKAVWTGTHMIMWSPGPFGYSEAYAFDPYTQVWKRLRGDSTLTARNDFALAWTGSELLTWGGYNPINGYQSNGAKLKPSMNSSRIKQIVAGYEHSCALRQDGKVKCWGRNNVGQLGLGNTSQLGDSPSEMGASLPFVDLGSGRTAIQLALGISHSCALLDNFKVKCWGGNNYGQLGLGDLNPRGDGPNEMGDSLSYVNFGTSKAKAISTAGDHTCALLDDGKMWCWGDNSFSQIYSGGTPAATPVQAALSADIAEMAPGWGHTCARLNTGTAYDVKCWGDNTYRQLGNGGNASSATPTTVAGSASSGLKLVPGAYHNCVHTYSGLVCWGANDYGQRGVGTMTTTNTPTSIAGAFYRLLVHGYEHACGINKASSAINCWGNGLSGGIGQDSTSSISAPASILGPSTNAVGITAGQYFSCAWYTDNAVKCWGANFYGQLGAGNNTDQGGTSGSMSSLPNVDLGF